MPARYLTPLCNRRRFVAASAAASVVASTALRGKDLQAKQPQEQAANQSDPKKRVAVTIDDGPASGAGNDLDAYLRISGSLRKTFVEHQVPGIVFVNERQLHVDGQRDARIRELEQWLVDGLDIGNHTYAHKRMREVPAWEYRDDIVKGETVLRPLLEKHGKRLTWFRYPFLDSGRDAKAAEIEEFLRERDYRIAPVTVDYKDYSFARNYTRFLRAGESAQAEEVLDSVWKALDRAFEHSEQRSQNLLGYQLSQVLLIHCNEMNALTLGDAFQRIRDLGYEFVSLEEAMLDAAYATPGLPPGSMGGWVMDGLTSVRS